MTALFSRITAFICSLIITLCVALDIPCRPMGQKVNIDKFELTFEEEVLNSDKTVLVDFYATWCGPCKMFGPIFEEAKENHTDVKFCKLNVDEDTDNVSKDFGVMSIPTIIAFKDGKEVKRKIGFMNSDDLNNFLEEL